MWEEGKAFQGGKERSRETGRNCDEEGRIKENKEGIIKYGEEEGA